MSTNEYMSMTEAKKLIGQLEQEIKHMRAYPKGAGPTLDLARSRSQSYKTTLMMLEFELQKTRATLSQRRT